LSQPLPSLDHGILRTEGLTRRFGELLAVNNLTFEVKAKEIFGLVGPNGAGKSTLIRMLTTLMPPTSGKAWVCGFEVSSQPSEVRRSIGYVPQLVSADGDLTARENLRLYATLYDVPRAEREERIEKSLEYMDLADVGDKLVREFSGGMIRRLEIGQSLLHRPRIVFLDEPTVGLDPIARTSVWKHIKGLQEGDGTTVVLTTHLMEEAETLCSRVGIMHRGVMAALGSVPELKAATGNPNSTLDEVFIHFAGDTIEAAGQMKETSRTRRTARRFG
jgi:ABC-2 type transport system ATP-binding protein